jgi:hypothetical protein
MSGWVFVDTLVAAPSQPSWPAAIVSESRVGVLPPGHLRGSMPVSEDGLHVAFVVQSSDGKGAFVVHDDKIDDGYQSVVAQTFHLSPDGNHVAYWAQLRKGFRLIADHAVVVDAEAPGPSQPRWSRDGTRFAYTKSRGKQVVLVVDGTEGPEWEAVAGPQFSGDGRHVAYVARADKRLRVIIDGVEGPMFDEILEFTWSPRGSRFAYLGRTGKQLTPVIDGVADSVFSNFGLEPAFTWSPDGRHVAYSAARAEDNWHVRTDARPGPPYTVSGRAVFSTDGEHLAFWGRQRDSDDAPRVLVRDGQVIAQVNLLAGLSLSPDGSRLAYVEALDERQSRFVVVVDGTRSPEYQSVQRAPVFSPDSRHVAFVAELAGRAQLVVDGQVTASHDAIYLSKLDPYFGPDGGHRSYVAIEGGAQRVFHDGAQGPAFKGILQNAPSVRADGSVDYLAMRGDTLVRVRQQPGTR